jgi:hypothetical protein
VPSEIKEICSLRHETLVTEDSSELNPIASHELLEFHFIFFLQFLMFRVPHCS